MARTLTGRHLRVVRAYVPILSKDAVDEAFDVLDLRVDYESIELRTLAALGLTKADLTRVKAYGDLGRPAKV